MLKLQGKQKGNKATAQASKGPRSPSRRIVQHSSSRLSSTTSRLNWRAWASDRACLEAFCGCLQIGAAWAVPARQVSIARLLATIEAATCFRLAWSVLVPEAGVHT